MWARWLALMATVWTCGYVAAYLVIVGQDGNAPAWWYVALLAIGMVPLVAALAGRLSRPAMTASAVVLALAALLGLLSIGLLLLPSVAAVIVAVSVMKPTSSAGPDARP